MPQLTVPSDAVEVQTPYTFQGRSLVGYETNIHIASGPATAHVWVRKYNSY